MPELASSTSSVVGTPSVGHEPRRGHVDLAAHRAPLAHELPCSRPRRNLDWATPGVNSKSRRMGVARVVTGPCSAPCPSVATSLIAPLPLRARRPRCRPWPRCARRRGGTWTVTRSPVLSASGPPESTTWSRAVSAPSSRMRAQANGVWSGCLGWGWATQAHDSTTPPGPTSTSLAGVVAGCRVVLGGRHDDRAAGPGDPEQLPVAQSGQEGTDDRPDRA